jgi:hypothetical protein
MAAALYVLNHIFFALALAIKTYFQKIATPGDIAPTAAVAFTINHIAAVFLPAALGYLWLTSPISVFLLAAGWRDLPDPVLPGAAPSRTGARPDDIALRFWRRPMARSPLPCRNCPKPTGSPMSGGSFIRSRPGGSFSTAVP